MALLITVVKFRSSLRLTIAALVTVVLLTPVVAASNDAGNSQPLTTSDPSIPTEDLELLLIPLSKLELLIEAKGWQDIVKAKAQEIARAEIAVRRQTQEIARAEEIQEKAAEARKHLEEVAAKIDEAKTTGDAETVVDAQEAAAEARESIADVDASIEATVEAAKKTAEVQTPSGELARQSLDETSKAAKRAKRSVADIQDTIGGTEAQDSEALKETAAEAQHETAVAKQAVEEVQAKVDQTLIDAQEATKQAAALDQAATAIEQAEETKKAEKIELLETVTKLREQRTQLLDNMRAVIAELEAKTDKDDADTLATIKDYRRYISTVSGIHVDVTDTTSAWVSLKGWAMSREGGIRWAINIASFVGILILAWFLSRLLSRLIHKAMSRVSLPILLEDFLVKSVRWVVMIVGVIWALSALEVSVGPLLALVGAAGFILAFAMQDSLSNFASGLMILFFRPFDTGDVIEAGGVAGTVRSMNLVATTIRTFDNSLMVVPNSKIWSDVITNVTGVTQRRVDMEFSIGYSDDIDLALKILDEIVSAHPKVLKDPPPVIKMSALGESSVNFICRPWATPADYWDVYWDVTKEVKRRFDSAGIGIPFPQRDVHLYIEKGGDNAYAAASNVPAKPAPKPHGTEGPHDDGGLDASSAGR
jgi:small conductance mechanosensitive channel